MTGTKPTRSPIEALDELGNGRVRAAQQQIAAGEMDTPERLDEAPDRMLDTEMPAPAWAA